MSYDEELDGVSLGELNSGDDASNMEMDAAEEAAIEAAATQEIDDSQMSETDAMRRRSAERRAARNRRDEKARRKARRKEMRSNNPDSNRTARIVAIVVAVLLCVCLVAGGVYYYYFRSRNAGQQQAQRTGPDASMDFGNITVVSASGTTSIGMAMETFELNLSDVDLEIEEVYVSNRDEVEQGQAILKISEDSIASARTALQQTAQSAEYAYQLNEIDAQEDVIEAKDTYEQALLTLQYAEQDYADTIAEAQAEINTLQTQVDDQQEVVDEYQSAVNDSSYYATKYKVADLKAQLEKDQELLNELYYDNSNGIADHLDYVYGGSYEAYLTGTSTTTTTQTNSQQQNGTGQQGGSAPSGDAGSMPNPGTGNGGSQQQVADAVNTENKEEVKEETKEETEEKKEESAEAASSEATTSNEEITQSDTSEVVSNEVYYTSNTMPSGSTGTMSAPDSSTSSTSSSSTSSGATISDLYTSASSTSSSKSLSTSSLSKSDLANYPLYSAYVALAEEVTEEHTEYEEAVAKAERAQENASALLKQAQNKLTSLELQLRTAQNNLTTTQETAQETLDTAKAEATAAEETYNTSIRSIENTADTLKDAMDEADENLAAFEEQIGDGYLYTSTAGTIMMVNAEAGGTLTYNQMIVAYTDEGSISVTAAVDQSNIASIAVGDDVAVVFDEAGIYQGWVSAINPVTQSSSRTSVTYSVTITLKGDVSAVSENISATVYFGDAVPLVIEQAGDQYHDPNATTESSNGEPGVADADMVLDNMMVNDDGTNYVPDSSTDGTSTVTTSEDTQ